MANILFFLLDHICVNHLPNKPSHFPPSLTVVYHTDVAETIVDRLR